MRLKTSFARRASRARELVSGSPQRDLLAFVGQIFQLQEQCFRDLQSLSDVHTSSLLPWLDRLLVRSSEIGTNDLKCSAASLLSERSSWEQMLEECWHGQEQWHNPDFRFFLCAVLQPYGELIAERSPAPSSTSLSCAICGRPPALIVLRPEGEGARRSLLCFLCGSEWTFRRLACPVCEEARPDSLPVYQTEAYEYIRIDGCDTCHHYLKAIDLSRNGHAEPIVDDLASLALDIWARERGYAKPEMNLFGF